MDGLQYLIRLSSFWGPPQSYQAGLDHLLIKEYAERLTPWGS